MRSNETFEWLDGGYFLVHRYETCFGDQPVQRGVMYWGYDAATEGFLLHLFSNNGPFTVEGNIYEGDIRGNALICTGPARFAIPLDHDGRILVNDEGSFETFWELRDRSGVWRPWMHDIYRRTTDPAMNMLARLDRQRDTHVETSW